MFLSAVGFLSQLQPPSSVNELTSPSADIRQSCAIQSNLHGSIMTVPREKGLVRFYIQLLGTEGEEVAQQSNDLPQSLVKVADKIMNPYSLKYEICDWCSSYTVSTPFIFLLFLFLLLFCGENRWLIRYKVGRRLAKTFRPHDRYGSPFRSCLINHINRFKRIFLVGDAAHTHSPMGGQGMNVSIQDSYNLIWKLGAVLTGHANPLILATYESERRPVAEKLMDLDSRLVREYEYEGSKDPSYISQARDSYAGFMSGVDVTYEHSMLVDNQTADYEATRPAKKITLGMRIPSVSLLYQCDGTQEHLGRRLRNDGYWRLLVFPGDLREKERMATLDAFADVYVHLFRMKPRQEKLTATVEPLLIHSSPRDAINLLDLPDIFHPFDDRLGWNYWQIFAEDDQSPAYQIYGIEREESCCLVLCRPDHHVAWIGNMDNANDLKTYFRVLS